jgi:hypothetical protein
MNTFRKITLGKYHALHEKGAPKAISTICVLTGKHDENLNPIQEKSWIVILSNHKDRVWSKCTISLLIFVVTLFGCWFRWRSKSIAPSAKAIAMTHFAKVFCPRKKLPSFDLPRVIQRLSQMNIGFFSGPFMAIAAALNVGTRKSPIFSLPLVLPPLLRFSASSPVLFEIPTIPTVMFTITPSLLVSTLTSLFTSQRIPRSRTSSAAFSASVAKWILW